MKTTLATVIAFLLISNVSNGQFRLGIKGGSNITKIDGVSFKDEFRYGYHLGGFAEIGIGEKRKFAIQPEVLFNQYSTSLDSNYKSVYQNVIGSDQSKVKLNYLSVPILLNYKLLGPIWLQAGPQFSVLMSKDKNFLQNGAEAFKKGDFAMLGGVQIKLAKLRVTGRYTVGLNNINDIDNRDKWKNQGLQLSLGLAL